MSSRFPHEIQPFIHSFQRTPQTYIDHDETGIRVTHVGWDEGSETLLSSSVPQLKSQSLSLDLHCFGDEIDTHSGLNQSQSTLDVNSKESWIKREMIDVFPTFWSPTSTTLNLLNLGIYYI